MELKAPLAHPCRPAVLICAAASGCDVTIGVSEADLQVPVLTGSTGTTSGMVSVLQAVAQGSALYPENKKVAIDELLNTAEALCEQSQSWLKIGAGNEARASSKTAITQLLAQLDAGLTCSSSPPPSASLIGGASLSLADVALACVLQPLFSCVLGPRDREAHPSVTDWMNWVAAVPEVAKVLGPLQLNSGEGWVSAPSAAAPAGTAAGGKKKKAGVAQDSQDGKAAAEAGAAAEAAAEVDDQDPEKAARKKAARLAEKEAKAAKFAAKQEAAAAKKAASAQPKEGGDKKAALKAEADAKKAAEAEEVARLLAEVKATPKGAKKDISKAAAKAYNPSIVEAAWYEWWEECGFFKPDVHSDKPPFVIVIPPPNVTGALHIGHALTNSIQDTIVRWRRMSGYNTVWVPGTDHAGIATQTVVEKKLQKELGKTRHDLGRDAFLEQVWGWVGEYGGRICDQLRRLGSSVDWSRQVFTMDTNLSRAVNEAFVRMHEAGVIYRDNRLVNWDCKLKTAVSDIEVDYVDIPRRTLLNVPGYAEPVEFGVITSFAYPLEGGEGEIVVATTRPETMLGDTAVAVHPDDPRYLHLHGKSVVHPVSGRSIPIICDAELVDMTFGTGAVKITPAHDPNDFKTGKRHNLEFINLLDDNGCINENGGPFAGQPRFKARVTVVEMLKAKGLFRGVADNEMRLGLCSRSKDVIEPVLKPQWWVKCDVMAARSCEAVRTGELEILPKEFEAVWFRWLENIRDWCISRQLWWGHRIPAYYIHLEDEGSEAGGSPGMPSEDMSRWVVGRTLAEAQAAAEARYPGRAVRLSQDEDVLDTWFSSGLFPFSVFKWPEPSLDLDKFYPGALLETGHDILFFWVARMVMMGLQLTGKVPFKQVYLHAMVRDAHGRKMSKTLGNVIDPLHVIEGITLEGLHATVTAGNLDSKEVAKAIAGQTADFPDGIEQCGTDALRFALCAYTTQARDINLDIKRVVSYRHWCNKLYNAIRFASLNFPPSYQPPEQPLQLGAEGQPALPQAARWLLSKLSGACAAVVKALEAYDFATATQRLYSFWQYEVCDVYIEVMKPLMALDESQAGNAEVKRATRDTLWVALEVGLRLLHPFMPFVTEELWQRLPQPAAGQPVPSIMLAAYPSATPAWDNPQLEAEYDYLNAVINKVRGLRNDYSLTKQRPHLFLVASDSAKAAVLQRSTLELATLSTSSEVTVLDSSQGASSSPPLGCGVCIVDDATVAHLLLKGILDPALEVAKLQKKLAEVQGRQEALAKKVSAPGYADKTPESIRADDLDRGAKAEAEKAAVLAAIADMQALLGSSEAAPHANGA
ncbi:tRNA synthetases class I-domain-containing protein [Haematococcus lacustris]